MQQEQQPNGGDARTDGSGSSPETNPPAAAHSEANDTSSGTERVASDKTVDLGQTVDAPASDKAVDLGQTVEAPASDKTVDLGQTVEAPAGKLTQRGSTTVKTSASDETAGSVREIVELSGEGTVQGSGGTTQMEGAAGTNEPPRSLVIQTRQVRDDEDQDVSGADYILEKQIGKGGMGLVLRAHQSSVGRKVALKSMLPQFAEADSERVKFVTEAVVTAAMDHPNVVPIYDLGVNEDGSLFYVMKEIEGTPWNDCIRDKTLAENLDILLRMGDAMAYAHARNYIHRDLKPENIMVGSFGEVLVMDWGLAVSVYEPESWNLAGTPAYMAPEMASHPVEGLGFHSDIYLMGAILYEILTGSPAHAGEDVMDCVRNAARNQLVVTDIDNELIDIARTAMATEVADRYGSIVEFQQAVREYQTHAESVAMSDRAAEQLAIARQNDDYDSYAQARFGFHEATTIWPENDQAQNGQREALLGHAQCALAKEDFGLGLSLLAEFQDAPVELLRNLQRGQNQRQRARTVKRVMVGLLVLAVVAATVALVIAVSAQREASRQEGIAREKADEAVLQQGLAQAAQGEAEIASVAAQLSADEAVLQQGLAQAAQGEAEIASVAAQLSAAEAKASAYRATVGQVAALIENDEFKTARTRLKELTEPSAERGWEWSRLDYLTSLHRSKTDFEQPLVAVAWSTKDYLAVADTLGIVTLIPEGKLGKKKGEQALQAFQLKRPRASAELDVWDLAFSPSGEKLAVVGQRGSEQGLLEVWDVASHQLLVEMPQPPATSITTCRYLEAGDTEYLLVGTAAGQLLCLQTVDLVSIEQVDGVGAIQQLAVVDRTSLSGTVANSPPLVLACGADGVALWEFVDQGSASRFRSLGKFREHTGSVAAVAAIAMNFSGGKQDVLIVSSGVDRSGLGQTLLWTLADWRDMLAREQTLSGLALRTPDGASGSSTVAQTPGKSPQLLRLSLPAKMRSVGLKWSSPGRHADGESQSVHLLLAGSENTLHHRTLGIRPRSAVESDSESNSGDWEATGNGSWTIVEAAKQLLRGHEKPLTQVLFDPREEEWRYVVTISADHTLKQWDLASYEEQRVARLLQSEQAIFSSTAVIGERVFAATQTGHLWEWPFLESADQPQRHFEGHQFLARHVALIQSGEERLLLTTSRDQSANLWNLRTQSQIRYWERFCGPLGLMAASPDGSQVITDAPSRDAGRAEGAANEGGGDQRKQEFPIYRWPLAVRGAGLNGAGGTQMDQDPEVLETPHRKRIIRIAFSPDSQHFATVDDEGVIYLWAADPAIDAPVLRRIPNNDQWANKIKDLCFLGPDILIVAFANGTIHEYRVESGEFMRVLVGPRQPAVAEWQVARVQLAAGPGSEQVAAQITETRVLPPPFIIPVYRYSVWLWSGTRDGAIRVSSADEEFLTPPTGIAYTPEGDWLATVQGPGFLEAVPKGESGKTLRLWSMDETVDPGWHECKLERRLANAALETESMVFLDRTHLVTVGRRSAIVWRISAEKKGLEAAGEQATQLSATEEFALEPQGAAHAIAASADDHFLVTANEEGTATLWDTDAARVAWRLVPRPGKQDARPDSIQAVAFATPHVAGKPYQLATGDSRGGLRIWQIDAADWTVEQWRISWQNPTLAKGITALAWREQQLVVGTNDGSFYLLDDPRLVNGSLGASVVRGIDWKRQGTDSETSKPVKALVFDPSGQYLAVAGEATHKSGDKKELKLRIYKRQTRGPGDTWMVLFRGVQGHSEAISCATFLGRGPSSRLATGSLDGAIKVWQWDPDPHEVPPEPQLEVPPGPQLELSARELLTLKSHRAKVSSLNFSVPNNALISSGTDGRIIVWEASPQNSQPDE